MLVKFENPALLSKSIELISELVTEVKIRFSEYGLSITAMDPANVSLVSFKIPKSAFSEYIAEKKEEALGVNLDNLKAILRRCGSKSILVLEKKENSNILEISIHDRIKRNFNLVLIEVETEEKQVPNLEFSAKVEISSVDIIDAIDDCNVVSDACSFIIDNGKFIVEAKSLNSARSEFSSDEVKIEAENCKARYSLEYLQKFMRGAKLVEKTILQFASEHPLRIDFKGEKMELTFILAPRVETED